MIGSCKYWLQFSAFLLWSIYIFGHCHIYRSNSRRFRNWLHGRNLSCFFPLGPYHRFLREMIPLLINVTKIKLEFDWQEKQSNMILNDMSMDDLAQFASSIEKNFEPFPHPLRIVFNTCLVKVTESMLFLESTSKSTSNHHSLHGAYVFWCTFYSEDSASCNTSMHLSSQLDCPSSQDPQSASLYQGNLAAAFSRYVLAALAGYPTCFPQIAFFIMGSDFVTDNNIIEHLHIKIRLLFWGIFFGFIGRILLLSINDLTKTSSGWVI